MKLPFELGVKLLFRLLLPGFILTLGLSPFIFFILDWINWPESHVYFLLAIMILSGWLTLILDMPIYMFLEGRRYWFPPLRKYLVKCERQRLERLRDRSALYVLEHIEDREAQLEPLKDQLKTRQKHADVEKKKYLVETNPLTRETLRRQIDADRNNYLAETEHLKVEEREQQIYIDERKYLEALFDIRNFPMNDEGEHRATFPTRLGNLIDAYEDYPQRVYGLDSVFYWPRLWLKLDKDLKEDIDGRQAVADSTVYVVFACYVSAAIWVVFALLGSINSLILQASGMPVFTVRHTLFEHLPPLWMVWVIAAIFFSIGFGLYRLSLRLHAQFGEIFKSVFDVFHDQIDVSQVMGQIAELADDYSFLTLPQKRRFQVARSYLQFGLIRCPSCSERVAAAMIKGHLAEHRRMTTTIQNSVGGTTNGN